MKPDSTAPDIAQRLRAAREARSMTVDDAAEALHLDHSVVMALEAAEFESLGAAVFVKGYLRAYARLLGLNEADVIEQCVVAEPDPEEFRSVSMRREVKTGASLPMVLVGGVLTALVLAGALYLWSSSEPPPESAVRSSLPRPAAPQPAGTEPGLPAAATGPSRVQAPAASESAVSARVVPEPEADEPAVIAPPPAPPPEPATVRLELSFTDECWVEISDARRRLLYGLEKAGSVRVFEAQLPLRFYLGKTDAVAISLAGVTYNVPPEVRTGRNTARFVVATDDLPAPGP